MAYPGIVEVCQVVYGTSATTLEDGTAFDPANLRSIIRASRSLFSDDEVDLLFVEPIIKEGASYDLPRTDQVNTYKVDGVYVSSPTHTYHIDVYYEKDPDNWVLIASFPDLELKNVQLSLFNSPSNNTPYTIL
jgi:hypothetical protein